MFKPTKPLISLGSKNTTEKNKQNAEYQKPQQNTIKIAFENNQPVVSTPARRRVDPRSTGGTGNSNYTLEQIRKQLFGFRLVTDPLTICDGADIKYIRIDGPGEYLYRDGGYLYFSTGDKFRLISKKSRASWEIFTDPAKNIIFYFYNPNIRAVISGQCEFISKQEIEDSGQGVLSAIGGGKISRALMNSDEGANNSAENRELLVKQMFGGKIKYDHSHFKKDNPPEDKTPVKTDKKYKRKDQPEPEDKMQVKTDKKYKRKNQPEPQVPPQTNKYNIESPSKDQKKKKIYEYESSYSDPEYSYGSNSTRKVTIRRNNPTYTMRPRK